MDFEKHEEEIKKMVEPLKNKKPPASLMKDYENQVMDKIHAAQSGPSIGIVPVLCLGVVFAGALIFIVYSYMKPAKQVEPPAAVEAVVPTTITKEVVDATATKDETVQLVVDYANQDQVEAVSEPALQETNIEAEEAFYASLADDLFLLEMLGEDEGLLDDFDRIESDLDLWIQATPTVVT